MWATEILLKDPKGDIILHILLPSHRGVGCICHRAHPSVREREHIPGVCNNTHDLKTYLCTITLDVVS